ncbi:hypothetical protein LJY25_00875 [Hymenobacter sp. BT175]|uniref:TapB family protein n=1 Tax=Hymenobacter translucens TaxID=2886507 RepID=UPI001D0E4064|nr:hypothetical protein [Hymenobacter translucens]MCC2544982.1 hypothetical protein [Hymenobacter translucens]
MRIRLPLFLLLVLLQSAAAQTTDTIKTAPPTGCDHPFGLADNHELVYQLLDEKGKPSGIIRTRVVRLSFETNKKKTVTTTNVLVKSGVYDQKNRLQRQQDLTFSCRRDTTFSDGLADFNPEALKSFRDRKFEYVPTALAWPNQPTTGSKLPDGGVTVNVSSSVVAIAKVSTMFRKRRVVSGLAAVTTPAGTFPCYKVESERDNSTSARADVAFHTLNRVVDYYSPGHGVVKTEIYGKNGKLVQTRVLASRTGSKE